MVAIYKKRTERVGERERLSERKVRESGTEREQEIASSTKKLIAKYRTRRK